VIEGKNWEEKKHWGGGLYGYEIKIDDNSNQDEDKGGVPKRMPKMKQRNPHPSVFF